MMTEEIADRTVDIMIDSAEKEGRNALWVNFHGGEPILNVGIIKYTIERIKEKNSSLKLHTSLTTNCTIWDEEICSYIDEITVSLDGNKEANDKNRIRHDGTGSYDLIINNAVMFNKRKNGVRTRMVVSPNNTTMLYDGIIHLISLGFREIIPGIDFFDSNWTEELFDIVYEQLKRVKKYVKNNLSEDLIIGIIDNPIEKNGQCIVGCDGYQIGTDGKIYPCTYVVNQPEYIIGDVFNGIDNAAVKKINCLNNKKTEACIGCENYRCCDSTRCFMLNKMLTNDYYSPSAVVCASEHLKIKLKRMV
jgi:uncharacterized protein